MKIIRLKPRALGIFVSLLLLCSCATTPEPSAFVPASELPADVTMNKDAGHGGVLSGAGRDDPAGRVMMEEAQRIIAAYHEGQPRTNNALRVVYFVPQDRDPLPHYAERLDRVMNDVSDFYRDGLRRLGIDTTGLPLERKEGKLVVHLVRGQLPASEYHYDPVGGTEPEIHLALKGTMDVEREHLLVFYALCRKESDGRYVFNAPYYGSGSQRSGWCHAADCELLDPLLLTDTNRPMVFTEHYYPRVETTVARFNSMYLGGTAHELGHALGLPHDDGSEPEKSFGVSLMGEGNLTYRQELWGGGPPTYLGRASALQLASHPLFTGSDRGRWDTVESGFKSLAFSAKDATVRIQGVVTGAVPPYAVIAYAWPESDKIDDHLARTFPCVLKDGAFTLDLDGLRPGNWKFWHLKLARLHVNGAAVAQEFRLGYDASSAPEVAVLNAQWIVAQAESAMEKKKWDEALDDLAAAEKLIPEVNRAAMEDSLGVNRFKILLGKKEYPAAYKLAAKLSDAHQDDSGLQNDLAWQIVSDKTIEKPDLGLAELLANRANKAAKGKDPDILDTQARVLFMKGQKKEAIETQAKAVALAGPDDKQTLQNTLDSYKKGELPAVNEPN